MEISGNQTHFFYFFLFLKNTIGVDVRISLGMICWQGKKTEGVLVILSIFGLAIWGRKQRPKKKKKKKI
jgi:hypothetical protein